MSGTAKTAQIAILGYGKQLVDAEFPLTDNGTAYFPLLLTSPIAQQMQLAIHRAVPYCTLYLTYEGTPVWNLTESAYSLDLSKGNTEGYGLLLVKQYVPTVPTENEQVEASQPTDKLLLNGIMYILHDGTLYDLQGKRVHL